MLRPLIPGVIMLLTEFSPRDEIDAVLGYGHPNPERVGCPPPETLDLLARALQGLTLDEARYALRRGLAASPSLGPEARVAVLEEKRLLVNRSGYISGDPARKLLERFSVIRASS